MNLYYELLQYPVFSMKEVNALYSSERTARAALEKLLKKNMVVKIRNKLYTCVSGENGGPVANKFQIASAITPSSYVSHHTAFEYYGIVDQVYYEVYVGSETRFHDFEFDGYTYHYISPINQSGLMFFNTLFDENACCHVAAGAGFSEVLDGFMDMSDEEILAKGINDSLIHVDFMVGSDDLHIVGIHEDGSETDVFVNGTWAE